MHTRKLAAIVVALLFLAAVALLALPATAAAAPLRHGEQGPGGEILATWKAIFTTVVLAIGLVEVSGQAVIRGWVKVGAANKKQLIKMHRWIGIAALVLVLAIFAACMYVMYGPAGGGTMMVVMSPPAFWHSLFGGLLIIVLAIKTIASNWVRRHLRVNVPLGIAAGALTLGVFLTSSLPHFLGG